MQIFSGNKNKTSNMSFVHSTAENTLGYFSNPVKLIIQPYNFHNNKIFRLTSLKCTLLNNNKK